MRSFRRWTGSSPGQLRREAVKRRHHAGSPTIDPPRDEWFDARPRAGAHPRRIVTDLELRAGKPVADADARHRYASGARELHAAASAGWPPVRRDGAATRPSAVAARAIHWPPQRLMPPSPR
jgi:hypothetical protein